MKTSRQLFTLSVTPSAAGARAARRAMSKVIGGTDISTSWRNALLLSATEWITNLGQHPTVFPQRVEIELMCIGSTYTFEISDDGSPFSDFQEKVALNGTVPSFDESGMGLQLIARYFPALTYISSHTGNRLRIQFHRLAVDRKPLILLVDDDPVIRNVHGEYLKDSYRTLLADSADEALQILCRTHIDLVMSDIKMPGGVSGLNLCADMRRNQSLETVPFVFLTGNKARDVRDAAQGLAIDDFLLKPVRKETILSCAKRVIRNARFIKSRLGDRFDEDLSDLLHPALPKILGKFNVGVRWQTAEAGGGDLLFHRRWENGTLIVLADLMGHGAQAKFYSQALAGYLYGMLAAVEEMDPTAVLSRLNKAFAEEAHLSQTLATVMAVLLLDDGKVRIANAGQPRPLLISSNEVNHLPVSGALMGLELDSEFDCCEFDMKEGEQLCLYTDGLAEIGDSPDAHAKNFAHILTTLEGAATIDVEETATRIELDIDQILIGPPHDDITFIILKYGI